MSTQPMTLGCIWAALTAGRVRQCVALSWILAVPAAAQIQVEKPCSLSGEVVDAGTGGPLADAFVTIEGGDPGAVHSAKAGADGRFAVEKLGSGTYRVSAVEAGFASMEYGAPRPYQPGRPVTYSGDACVAGVRIALPRLAVVTGRVLDEDRNPVKNAPVSALCRVYRNGVRGYVSEAFANSDDLGRYRLFDLPPGQYWLYSEPPKPAAGKASGPEDQESYGRTYYPHALELAAGSPVQLMAGQTLPGLDVVLRKRRTVRVRGRVTSPMPASGRIQVALRHGAAPPYNAWAEPDGAFEFGAVDPGRYSIKAVALVDGAFLSAHRSIEAGRENIDGVPLPLQPPLSVSGILRWVEDSGKPAGAKPLRVTLMPREWERTGILTVGARVAEAAPEGGFVLEGAEHDEYRIEVDGLPENAYVESARMGGVDVLSDGLDLTEGAAGVLDILVDGGGGTVVGRVADENGKAAAGATVVLIPQFGGRATHFEFHRVAASNEDGSFALHGLPPGEYLAAAWLDIERGAWMEPGVFEAAQTQAVKVTVRRSEAANLTLKALVSP